MAERNRRRYRPGTFSIAAHDPAADSFGAAVATGTVAVGATCPYVSANAAALTQSFTKTEHGRDAVARADAGEPIDEACEELLAADEHASYRQLHGVDADGNAFAFSGDDCDGWYGSTTGDRHTVAGNMLAGPEVVDAVDEAFTETEGDLAERLVSALEAGAAAGGDKRGERSAALLIHAPEPTMYHNLRIDSSDEPVTDLRDLLEEARTSQANIREDVDEAYDDYPEEILNFGVKY